MQRTPPAHASRQELRRHILNLEDELRRVRRESQLLRGGHVEIVQRVEGREDIVASIVSDGPNRLTDSMRVIAAKVLARKASQISPATFPLGIEGYDADDPVFPAYLYIGTDPAPAQRTDVRLGTFLTTTATYPDLTAVPLRYPLARVLVRDAVDDYTDIGQAVNVAFEFDIPVGTLRSGGDAESSPILVQEFGLYTDTQSGGDEYPIEGNPASSADPQVATDNPPILLARRAASLIKLFEGSYTVRWRIWT